MITTCFFDKSNNSMTASALKQLLNRRENRLRLSSVLGFTSFSSSPHFPVFQAVSHGVSGSIDASRHSSSSVVFFYLAGDYGPLTSDNDST